MNFYKKNTKFCPTKSKASDTADLIQLKNKSVGTKLEKLDGIESRARSTQTIKTYLPGLSKKKAIKRKIKIVIADLQDLYKEYGSSSDSDGENPDEPVLKCPHPEPEQEPVLEDSREVVLVRLPESSSLRSLNGISERDTSGSLRGLLSLSMESIDSVERNSMDSSMNTVDLLAEKKNDD